MWCVCVVERRRFTGHFYLSVCRQTLWRDAAEPDKETKKQKQNKDVQLGELCVEMTHADKLSLNAHLHSTTQTPSEADYPWHSFGWAFI